MNIHNGKNIYLGSPAKIEAVHLTQHGSHGLNPKHKREYRMTAKWSSSGHSFKFVYIC